MRSWSPLEQRKTNRLGLLSLCITPTCRRSRYVIGRPTPAALPLTTTCSKFPKRPQRSLQANRFTSPRLANPVGSPLRRRGRRRPQNLCISLRNLTTSKLYAISLIGLGTERVSANTCLKISILIYARTSFTVSRFWTTKGWSSRHTTLGQTSTTVSDKICPRKQQTT